MNINELNKFKKLSNQWWNQKGSLGLLHKMNPIRIKYIRNHLNSSNLSNLSILDNNPIDYLIY